MDRPTNQYCSEETEFSLPEGVDLVGTENSTGRLGKPMAYQTTTTTTTASSNSSGRAGLKGKPATWKAAVKLVVINLFVCGLVLGYALIGSFVFLALEGNRNSVSQVQVSASGYPVRKGANLTLAIYDSLQGEQIQQLKSDTVRNIWEITLSMNILYPDNWTKMTSEEVGNFQRFLVERILSVVENATEQDIPYSWTFPRAFLFALTTLTTIGYGGIGPKTSTAKIATMIYAIFGIPIMLWYLSNVGSLLAKIARYICAKLCCCCCSRDSGKGCSSSSSSSTSSSTRKVSDPYNYHMKPVDGDIHRGGGTSRDDDAHHHRHHLHGPNHHHLNSQHLLEQLEAEAEEHRVSILVILFLCLAILLAYICLGSYIVTRWEKWRFIDSFYFCFLTLTTISFGDSRARRNGGLERLNQKTEWFCSFYILLGMALTSMFFNILHEEISHRFKRWKQSPMDPSGDSSKDSGGGGSGNKMKRRPVENSYSVHFMNFGGDSTTTSRNFTEETLLSNEMHNKRSITEDDEDVIPNDYIVSHPIPPPREIYGSHPVFPR